MNIKDLKQLLYKHPGSIQYVYVCCGDQRIYPDKYNMITVQEVMKHADSYWNDCDFKLDE